MLSTYSRLVIDPNRGLDDPTLVMRYSDGAIVPGNATIDAAEIARRSARFWAPYRQEIAAAADAMIGDWRASGADLDPFVHAGLARILAGRGRSGSYGIATGALRNR